MNITPLPSALVNSVVSHLPLKEDSPDLGTISTHPTAAEPGTRKPVAGSRGGRGGPKKASLTKQQVAASGPDAQTTEAAPRQSTRPKAAVAAS